MKKIKPSFPYILIMIAIAFFFFAIVFLVSPYQDWKMEIATVVFASLGFVVLWMMDYACLTIYYNSDVFKFKGYFSLRKLELNIKQIEGYEIYQKVDSINGLHEEIQLVIKGKGNLILPKGVYDNYEEVKSLFAEKIKFLGYKPLKYGQLLGKIIPAMFIISGFLAMLVGIIKFLK